MQRLIRNLQAAARLRAGLSTRNALALIMVLTSYESYRELREAGVSEREVTTRLQDSARALLIGPG